MKNSPLCDCGQIQTIGHVAEECSQTRYKGGIEGLHKGDDGAMDWLSIGCLELTFAFKYIMIFYYY